LPFSTDSRKAATRSSSRFRSDFSVSILFFLSLSCWICSASSVVSLSGLDPGKDLLLKLGQFGIDVGKLNIRVSCGQFLHIRAYVVVYSVLIKDQILYRFDDSFLKIGFSYRSGMTAAFFALLQA
jgi:hypothetical protein